MVNSRIPERSEITDETPVLLDVAAALAFPDGSVSGLALRNAVSRGELGSERIGGRLYTTLAAIKEMRALKRVEPKVRPKSDVYVEDGGSALASALAAAKRLRAELAASKSVRHSRTKN